MKRILLPGLAIFLVFALVLTGFNVSVSPKEKTFTVGDRPTLRIGFGTGVYAAPDLDYTISGTADDEFQAAINALPATGGRIEAMSGTYTFAATVARAIPGVIIQGQGVSTVFNHDAATPLFSAGSQSGWQFRDFKTDAGGITVTSASNWSYSNITVGSNYYTSYCSATQGSTFPSTPFTGQQFLHNTTGRKVLYQYDGSAWQPIQSYGTITVYVDPSGTDGQAYGYTTGASAYKTIDYAYDQLPRFLGGDATINLSANTFTENLVWEPKCGHVIIQGSAMSETDKTATGGAAGTVNTATTPRVSGTFSANQYDNKLISFTSGANSGAVRVIGLTTTTNLYLNGGVLDAAPQNNDTYHVLNWTSQITGIVHVWSTIEDTSEGNTGHSTGTTGDITFRQIKFVSNNTSHYYGNVYAQNCRIYIDQCHITDTSSGMAVQVELSGFMGLFYTVVDCTGNTNVAVQAAGCGQLDIQNSRIIGTKATSYYGTWSNSNGILNIICSEISNFNYCVVSNINGLVAEFSNTNVKSFIHGANNEGCWAYQGGKIVEYSALFQYGTLLDGTADANTDDELADAASYSYIGQ